MVDIDRESVKYQNQNFSKIFLDEKLKLLACRLAVSVTKHTTQRHLVTVYMLVTCDNIYMQRIEETKNGLQASC